MGSNSNALNSATALYAHHAPPPTSEWNEAYAVLRSALLSWWHSFAQRTPSSAPLPPFFFSVVPPGLSARVASTAAYFKVSRLCMAINQCRWSFSRPHAGGNHYIEVDLQEW
mmetsp:Transcript_52637/g.111800  ORF Transcript_52637/g.111800 Transcript_52637/m.111800 type:complete len:112 (-) Transcript_52637:346-681(-)